MLQKRPITAPNFHSTLSMTESEAPPLVSARTGMSTTLSVNCRALSEPWAQASTTLFKNWCGNWNVHHSVERLDCWNKRCMITVTSQHHRSCTCGNSTVFCTVCTNTCQCTRRARQRGRRTATVESQQSSAQQRCADLSLCSNWNSHHSVDELRKHQRLLETVLHEHRDVHNRNVSHRRGGQYFYPALAWR